MKPLSIAKQIFHRLIVNQPRLIHKTKWDYLIILDACRYDYFKEEWDGKVQCVKSPASETCSWLQRTFPDYYPYTIHSTNPFINSKGIGHWRYHAKDHFTRVVDLWNDLWNEEYGTVLPESVFEATRTADPRSLVWFLQPHAPYINQHRRCTSQEFLYWKPNNKGKAHYEVGELQQAYKANLREVLKWVQKLIDKLHGKIIVTSDHGELLGEYGKVGHPSNMNVPELRNVPWVVIK